MLCHHVLKKHVNNPEKREILIFNLFLGRLMRRLFTRLGKDVEKLPIEMNVKGYTEGNVHYLKVSKDKYYELAKHLKEKGFTRLLTVSSVDWKEKGSLEVYFVLHKLDGNVYVKVATDLSRKNPVILSLSQLWPNAAMHERETWELFGAFFKGNEILEPLFLEDWKGPPPFNKEFDWREYVKKNYNSS
jgi:NADH:ubiquinone oxidoreductase subunit C